MKVTKTHLEYWQSYHLPSWAVPLYKDGSPRDSSGKSWLVRGIKAPSIDAVINATAGIRLQPNEIAWHNLLNLLKRKKGQELRGYLAGLIANPGCADAKKRRAYARRILYKLTCTEV